MEKAMYGSPEMNNEIIILVISFLILTGIIIFLLIKIKVYRKTLNRILDHMDLAISGTEQETEYDENIDAAITEKMNKLVNISRLNYEYASRDRDLVKSLISDITHQVRTPLTNIMLYAGLLQENAVTDDSINMAKQIQRQSEKLDFFMNELVKSSYMETEMIAVHREENSIDKLFAEACQEVELAALKKKIIF
jgi:signal transduction histidine kinase